MCGVWCVVCGVWCVVCGVRCAVRGVWCVVRVWYAVCVVTNLNQPRIQPFGLCHGDRRLERHARFR